MKKLMLSVGIAASLPMYTAVAAPDGNVKIEEPVSYLSPEALALCSAFFCSEYNVTLQQINQEDVNYNKLSWSCDHAYWWTEGSFLIRALYDNKEFEVIDYICKISGKRHQDKKKTVEESILQKKLLVRITLFSVETEIQLPLHLDSRRKMHQDNVDKENTAFDRILQMIRENGKQQNNDDGVEKS